jgi:anti-sigma-K factor RskA
MARNEHSLLRENLPAYALGALDAEDARALEAHLQTCKACRTELADYRAVSDNLLAALPPRQPSPALRKQLQSRLPSARPAQKTAQPRFVWSFGRLAAGVALLLLFVTNLFSFVQMRELQRQQLNVLRQLQNNQTALAMLSYPGTEALPIDEGNISGTLLLDRERNSAALIAWNLPELPEEQVYQIWLIESNDDRVSGGLFRSQADLPYTTQPVFSSRDISDFVGIGVTVEPAGGSDRPTGPRVMRVNF